MKLTWKPLVLLVLAGIIISLAGVYVSFPPSDSGLYDADLNRLAASPAEGWCAGTTYVKYKGKGNKAHMKHCLETTNISKEPHISMVIRSFCEGLQAEGFGLTVLQCQLDVAQYRIWPTADGRISRAFNDNFPYPGDTFTTIGSDTPDRQNDRKENSR